MNRPDVKKLWLDNGKTYRDCVAYELEWKKQNTTYGFSLKEGRIYQDGYDKGQTDGYDICHNQVTQAMDY